MHRFFIASPCGNAAEITGDDARHIIRSLRMPPGECVTLCDQCGFDYDAVIVSAINDRVTLDITGKRPSRAEPSIKVTLYQAMPKADKLEFVVQKAVELGVSSVVPVITDRCISRPSAESAEKKLERLRRIALEAAKQSHRGIVPTIFPVIAFNEAVSRMSKDKNALLLNENNGIAMKKALCANFADSISVMVGAEGGFDPQETTKAQKLGITEVNLGARILRCETAAIAAIISIMYESGNL